MPDVVCGVVVTYHPDSEVLENLRYLRPEVDHLVVVDNGSLESELVPLRTAAGPMNFELIEVANNLGIATALNTGIRRAEGLGSEWVLLFDQDSQVTDGFTGTLLRAFKSTPPEDRLAILIPRYVDKRLGTPMNAILEADGTIETAMTSGTLMRIKTFQEHGLFIDSLFIDGVDHEYSLRARSMGMSIKECADAVLLHSPGTPSVHRVRLRKKPFLSSNYSPIRRYYQERNKVWLVRRYWRTFPGFSKRQFTVSLKDLIKIVLFEKNKGTKCRFFFRGLWHGLIGRTGKLTTDH